MIAQGYISIGTDSAATKISRSAHSQFFHLYLQEKKD